MIRFEVHYSTDHHGQYCPDRPWCVIGRSPAGTPGEPQSGVRYLTSYATRERAVAEVAARRAIMDPRYKRAKGRLDALLASLEDEHRLIVEAEGGE